MMTIWKALYITDISLGTKRIKHHTIMSKMWTPFFNGTIKRLFSTPQRITDSKHPAHPTSICSYDVMRIQTKELSILLSVYFHEVLKQLNLYIQTNFRFKRVLCFAKEHAWISKLNCVTQHRRTKNTVFFLKQGLAVLSAKLKSMILGRMMSSIFTLCTVVSKLIVNFAWRTLLFIKMLDYLHFNRKWRINI